MHKLAVILLSEWLFFKIFEETAKYYISNEFLKQKSPNLVAEGTYMQSSKQNCWRFCPSLDQKTKPWKQETKMRWTPPNYMVFKEY